MYLRRKELMLEGLAGMTIADNFGPKSDAGFVRAYDARAARRQFQVSLALVLVLGLAAIALATVPQLDRSAAKGLPEAIEAGSSHATEILPNIRG
jgi:hypothetical protein